MLSSPHIHLVDSDTFREISKVCRKGLLLLTKRGQILIANPVAEQIFGYEKDA
jgi:PAS domain-containing protein